MVKTRKQEYESVRRQIQEEEEEIDMEHIRSQDSMGQELTVAPTMVTSRRAGESILSGYIEGGKPENINSTYSHNNFM